MKIKNRYLTGALPLLALAANASCSTEQTTEPRRPNVLFIYADDLGFGDVGVNGSSKVPTPNIDRIASEGINFTNAHATAATSTPSRFSMLTGQYAWRYPGTGIAAGDAAMIIKDSQYTIADMFKQAGYKTAAVGKWHLGLGSKSGEQDWNSLISPNPSNIGFDYSYIMAATSDRTPCIFIEDGLGVGLDPADPVEVSYTKNFEGEPTGKDNPELLMMHPSHQHDQSIVNGISRIGYMKGGEKARWKDEDIADNIVNKAIAFIERQSRSEEPFFLYVATNDIHVPHYPHSRFRGKSGHGLRGDAILSFDWSVGELWSALKRYDMDKNTIIVISSDNGPVLDDGYKDQTIELLGDHKPSGPFRGSKYSSFEAGTRVPCIIRWTGEITPGVSESAMSQIDWLRSFAHLVGVDVAKELAFDSQDHWDSWSDATESGREYIITQSMNNNVSIADDRWKYIPPKKGTAYRAEKSVETGNSLEPQLYDLSEDQGEQNNLYERYKRRAKRLDKKLTAIKEAK